jgi:hypothetical protein
VDTKIIVKVTATPTRSLDLQTVEAPLAITKTFSWVDGTLADQANRVWADQRTLGASANEELDLAGSLTNFAGQTITFTVIRAVLLTAAAANTNNVFVGGAAANGFNAPFAAVGDELTLRPGGLILMIARDTTGYAVTAGTGDLFRFENSAAGTSVTWDMTLVGVGTVA